MILYSEYNCLFWDVFFKLFVYLNHVCIIFWIWNSIIGFTNLYFYDITRFRRSNALNRHGNVDCGFPYFVIFVKFISIERNLFNSVRIN